MKLSGNNKINDIYNALIEDDKNKLNKYKVNNDSIDLDIKSRNIISIKDLINNKRKLPNISEINKRNEDFIKGRKIRSKFNYAIIKNKNWGSSNYIGENKDNTKNNFINNVFRKEK